MTLVQQFWSAEGVRNLILVCNRKQTMRLWWFKFQNTYTGIFCFNNICLCPYLKKVLARSTGSDRVCGCLWLLFYSTSAYSKYYEQTISYASIQTLHMSAPLDNSNYTQHCGQCPSNGIIYIENFEWDIWSITYTWFLSKWVQLAC